MVLSTIPRRLLLQKFGVCPGMEARRKRLLPARKWAFSLTGLWRAGGFTRSISRIDRCTTGHDGPSFGYTNSIL